MAASCAVGSRPQRPAPRPIVIQPGAYRAPPRARDSETIVGGIVGGAAAAAAILKAIGVWGTILEYHSAAWSAAQGFVGLCAGFLGAIHDADLHALPGAAYDHPAVA
ncbi:MAG: hypothetical protein HKP61_09795 [Dactylosporangium sp.]|nr:hypothetical protein [Dactylosporangium sp.]NNJ61225.1 hypothetical protein [Dactylosporangium sp.]